MKHITLPVLEELVAKKSKFSCVAVYDALFARLLCEAGVEVLLVGDSLAMLIQGHETTLPVTLEHMAYHTACVAKGNLGAFVIADMPFMSYVNEDDGLRHATTLMQAGANMVKLEGGSWLTPLFEKLTRGGIPVCGHLGLTPQSVNVLGGFLPQGYGAAGQELIKDALAMEAAGMRMLVLECVPHTLARELCSELKIPVIGIGAGRDTAAQVLVLHDLLGLNSKPPRFVQDFSDNGRYGIKKALENYVEAVRNGDFPTAEHCYS